MGVFLLVLDWRSLSPAEQNAKLQLKTVAKIIYAGLGAFFNFALVSCKHKTQTTCSLGSLLGEYSRTVPWTLLSTGLFVCIVLPAAFSLLPHKHDQYS